MWIPNTLCLMVSRAQENLGSTLEWCRQHPLTAIINYLAKGQKPFPAQVKFLST